jgi:hypothetical protein
MGAAPQAAPGTASHAPQPHGRSPQALPRASPPGRNPARRPAASGAHHLKRTRHLRRYDHDLRAESWGCGGAAHLRFAREARACPPSVAPCHLGLAHGRLRRATARAAAHSGSSARVPTLGDRAQHVVHPSRTASHAPSMGPLFSPAVREKRQLVLHQHVPEVELHG